MKKIISLLLMGIFLSSSFSFAQISNIQLPWLPCGPNDLKCDSNQTCKNDWSYFYCKDNSTIPEESDNVKNRRADCKNWSINETNISYIRKDTDGNCCYETGGESSSLSPCDPTKLEENQNSWWGTSPTTSVMGISCNEDQLVNGQCELNIYDTLGIRKSVRNTNDATSVGLFVQDIVLSATFFIGTLVTIALVVSGIMFIFAASSGKSPDKAKQWIIWSLIGLLIVVSSYVIIRLVQYIAKGF